MRWNACAQLPTCALTIFISLGFQDQGHRGDLMRHGGEDAGQQPGAERCEHQSAENGHAGSMARESRGVARIVSGIMRDVDVRKADRPDNESAEQSSEHRRGERSDLGRVCDPVAGREPMMCVCMIVSVAGVIRIPFTDAATPPPEPDCRAACLVDRKRIKKTAWGGICAMSCEYRFRAPRALPASLVLCLAGALLISGCSDLKKAMGLERTSPDEFAVESRAPLTMPPDFNLRPPQPGAAGRKRRAPTTGPPSHRTGGTRRAGQAGARFPSATRRGRASGHRRPQRSGA